MAYVFGPNRDAGSVSRHRNPDTRRRPQADRSVGCGRSCTYCHPILSLPPRSTVKMHLKAAIPEEIALAYEPLDEDVWTDRGYEYEYVGCSCGDPLCEYA